MLTYEMTIEPKGKLKVVGTEIKQNVAAIYIDVFLKDEDSNIFKSHSSSFFFNLELCSKLESFED